jgi:hypothetical protein
VVFHAHTGNLPDGCPQSAPAIASLWSRYLIAVPIANEPFSGSRMYDVPGSLKPFGMIELGTTGPNMRLQSSLLNTVSIAQPSASRRATRAFFHALAQVIS